MDPPSFFAPHQRNSPRIQKAVALWLQVLKEKRKTPSPTQLKAIAGDLAGWSEEKLLASLANSTKGGYPALYEPKESPSGGKETTDDLKLTKIGRHNKAVAEALIREMADNPDLDAGSIEVEANRK